MYYDPQLNFTHDDIGIKRSTKQLEGSLSNDEIDKSHEKCMHLLEQYNTWQRFDC